MKRFIKKTMIILLLLFVSISVVFFLIHSIGGGPSIINDPKIDESVKDVIRRKYGLDKMLYIQFLLFWKNLFSADFGVSLSIHTGASINSFIWTKFGYSILIGGIAAIAGILLGIGFGILIGLRPHKFFDKFMQINIAFFIAIPPFVIGLILIIVVSNLGLPITFNPENPVTWILPIIAIAIPSSMITTKFMRTRIIGALETQYARLALAKGVAPHKVIMRHLLKDALFTVATSIPQAILLSVVSSILIENMFTIPGLGKLYTQSIQTKDYNVVLAITTILVFLVSISFILRDFLYTVLDPRIKRRSHA